MYLRLLREPTVDGTTLGSLYVNGRRFCDTLEDAIREIAGQPVSSWKVKGETAIPAGRYRVRWSYSPKFNRNMPELVDVGGFTGIRMHGGVKKEDTEGCICVGLQRAGLSRLSNAGPAHIELDTQIEAAANAGEAIWIRVENPIVSEAA